MSETKEPRYFGSWKGRVIRTIAIDGARTWEDIRDNTGLFPTTLNRVFKNSLMLKLSQKLIWIREPNTGL